MGGGVVRFICAYLDTEVYPVPCLVHLFQASRIPRLCVYTSSISIAVDVVLAVQTLQALTVQTVSNQLACQSCYLSLLL